MKAGLRIIFAIFALHTVHSIAETRYVDVNNGSPAPPFTSWATAATNIQSAIDAATNGDQILVNDGVYKTGSKSANGPNRVAVTKPVTMQSVNGPAVTIIDAGQAMRCVYLTNGAALNGFSLTNGNSSGSGGGTFCESTNVAISNCYFLRNITHGDGGGTFQGTLSHCRLDVNEVDWSGNGSGGGAIGAVLNNCTLTNNRASLFGHGGGAHSSTLNNCLLMGNGSFSGGGGATSCELNNCTLSGNTILFMGNGGGAESSTLRSCILTGNSASYGGGVSDCTLVNCALSGNVSWSSGGGAGSSTLSNCTVVANSAAGGGGGGISDSLLYNGIAFHNTALDHANYASSTLNFSCTTPFPAQGSNNITAEPQLADLAHISSSSPCRGAGSVLFVSGTDIDGEAWSNSPSMGCDEFHAGAAIGSLTVTMTAGFTNVATNFTVGFNGSITGHATVNVWNFGDGTTLSNRMFAPHSWSTPGDYAVSFTVYNDANPAGVSASVTIYVATQSVFYVSQDSAVPVSPYASWATAATNIQDAVDVSVNGGTVLVSNGVYRTGGRRFPGLTQTNRVIVNKPLVVRSVNGPATTTIEGYQTPGGLGYSSVRCVYLTNAASLIGFTVTNGATQPGNDQDGRETIGGGVWCESPTAIISNCVITRCAAYGGGGVYNGTVLDTLLTNNSGIYGGGSSGGIFYNCLFVTNYTFAGGYGGGGGAYGSALYSCVLSNNVSDSGGAANSATLSNCTLIANTATGGGGVAGGVLRNCTLTGNAAVEGGGANGATLTNCVLSSNSAQSGGGVSQSVLFDCLLTNNLGGLGGGGGGGANASTLERCILVNNYGGGYGGGAKLSNLGNCLLTGNGVSTLGGGASECNMTNCTLYGNGSSEGGGGVSRSTLYNCIVYGNGEDHFESALNYCCTLPLPETGIGNFTNEPAFVDALGKNFRLQSNSPCINSGNNRYVTTTNGLDGNARIQAGTVDVGAYEFQAATSALSYLWLSQYGLPMDGSADALDSDGDSRSNLQEWIANTNPTNAVSVFRLLSITNDASGVAVIWNSSPDRFYTVERSPSLSPTNFSVIAGDIPGGTNTTTFVDGDISNPAYFYRVSVQQ